MATYEYDEAGVMAAYFLITFLALILVPLTFSSLTKHSATNVTDGCQCTACIEHRKAISQQEKGSLFNPKFTRRTYFLIGGWSLFAFVSYRASQLKVENKVYNPFEILGIKTSTPEKEIKSHFKQLSKLYHPDKVKVTANMTIEAIQEKFVEITKAYKSLTDEKIKENWIKYNHPDGPQSTSMGIALPKWIVEGKNRIWVMAVYGLIFGGALPALVGRWWFGSREKTKDGIHAKSAAAFFKSVREESSVEEVMGALGKAFKWDFPSSHVKAHAELDTLEKAINEQLGSKWTEVRRLVKDTDGELHAARRTALVLLYAHLLRLNINDRSLKKQQREVILQTPLLLNALLNISIARTWLLPTLAIMRLHSYITQALPPIANERLALTQLPGLSLDSLNELSPNATSFDDVLYSLEDKKDPRAGDVKKALAKWGKVDLVSASFKVIGETVVTPQAIIYLLVKLRITPAGYEPKEKAEPTVDEVKKAVQKEAEIDEKFLVSRLEAEELPASYSTGAAHAPYWPATKKPSWWIVLADDKSNRVVVPPVKITDIPYAEDGKERDYRSYKIQFQGPPNTGLFTWKVYIVSDTFVGEPAWKDISLKIEDPPAVEDAPAEDEISDPEEDSLAGQMAAMRGGAVKKARVEESDDESSTDDDKSDTDSDSDSD